jgi:ribonuclease HI
MTACIRRDETFGPSAFTADNDLVMNYGAPTVAYSLRIKDLEEWLTTLEEIMPSQTAHRYSLEGLYFALKAAHDKHKKQHEEVVTDAPSSDDLMDYLMAYAAALSTN